MLVWGYPIELAGMATLRICQFGGCQLHEMDGKKLSKKLKFTPYNYLREWNINFNRQFVIKFNR